MSETMVVLPKSTIEAAYKEGDKKDRALLQKLYGKSIISGDPKEWVKDFADICTAVGVNAADYTHPHDRVKLIAKVLNGDWTPDWANDSQHKYYPWFRVNKGASGFGLSFLGCGFGYACTYAALGSRLYYKDEDTARFAGTIFLSEYEKLFNH